MDASFSETSGAVANGTRTVARGTQTVVDSTFVLTMPKIDGQIYFVKEL